MRWMRLTRKNSFQTTITSVMFSRWILMKITDAPEDQPLLYRKFGDALSVELKVTFREKCDWLEDITSPELKRKLLSLSPKDLAILDLYVFEEKTQQEVAKEMQLSQQAIQKRLKKITGILGEDKQIFLRNFLPGCIWVVLVLYVLRGSFFSRLVFEN